MAKEETYPCADCGLLRTKEEGGTVFTVCDECWDKHYKKDPNELELTENQVNLISELWTKQINQYFMAVTGVDPKEFAGMRKAVEMGINKLKCHVK